MLYNNNTTRVGMPYSNVVNGKNVLKATGEYDGFIADQCGEWAHVWGNWKDIVQLNRKEEEKPMVPKARTYPVDLSSDMRIKRCNNEDCPTHEDEFFHTEEMKEIWSKVFRMGLVSIDDRGEIPRIYMVNPMKEKDRFMGIDGKWKSIYKDIIKPIATKYIMRKYGKRMPEAVYNKICTDFKKLLKGMITKYHDQNRSGKTVLWSSTMNKPYRAPVFLSEVSNSEDEFYTIRGMFAFHDDPNYDYRSTGDREVHSCPYCGSDNVILVKVTDSLDHECAVYDFTPRFKVKRTIEHEGRKIPIFERLPRMDCEDRYIINDEEGKPFHYMDEDGKERMFMYESETAMYDYKVDDDTYCYIMDDGEYAEDTYKDILNNETHSEFEARCHAEDIHDYEDRTAKRNDDWNRLRKEALAIAAQARREIHTKLDDMREVPIDENQAEYIDEFVDDPNNWNEIMYDLAEAIDPETLDME